MRTSPFGVSVAIHTVLLSGLLLIPLVFTDSIKVKFDSVLTAPQPPVKQVLEVTLYEQPPPKLVESPKPLVEPSPRKPLLSQPPDLKPPDPPKITEVILPAAIERERPIPILRNTPRLDEAEPTPAAPKIEVRTGSFSSGSPAPPSTTLPAQIVQTGGFGDPNGIKGEGKPGKLANIASLGSFDLPAGPGAGNGAGGAHGVRAIVASAGFANGEKVGNAGASGGYPREVRQGGFGSADAAKPEAAPKNRDLGPPQTPVEILFKPKPDYTGEARKLKVEGEILFRVLFTAGGDVRILDLLRGLGHGLDESAERAAQQIKFKPAQRDGQPVDSTATVHILFQLAY